MGIRTRAPEKVLFLFNEGGETMKLEMEAYEEENPKDEIWVRDGRGKVIKLEVEDDADDD